MPSEQVSRNELYLAVLPLVHVTLNQVMGYGLTEQTLTLFPQREMATKFFKDEVATFIDAFKWRADKYLTGGHIIGYDLSTEDTDDGRVIVRVIQNVR
jgi:hypothetical protein